MEELSFPTEGKGEKAKFAILVSFIRKSKKASDPTYGKQAMILKNAESTAMTSKIPKLNKARARSDAITNDVPKDLKKNITSNDKESSITHPLEHCESLLANPSMNDWMFSRTIETAMDASRSVMYVQIVAIKLIVLRAKGDIHQYYM